MSRGSGSLSQLIFAVSVANHRWNIGLNTGTVQIDKEVRMFDDFMS